MFNKLSIFALALALPLAACGDAETVETADDVDVVVTDPVVPADDMMTSDVTAQATLDAVPADGLTAMAPGAAVDNIDAWIAKLDGIPEASGVVEGLQTLKAQLTAETLDGNAIGETLTFLGGATTSSAGGDAALEQLGGALTSAGNALMGM